MLDYCAEHDIVSDIEMTTFDKVDEAYDRVVKSRCKVPLRLDCIPEEVSCPTLIGPPGWVAPSGTYRNNVNTGDSSASVCTGPLSCPLDSSRANTVTDAESWFPHTSHRPPGPA